jgi:hypothetical protein
VVKDIGALEALTCRQGLFAFKKLKLLKMIRHEIQMFFTTEEPKLNQGTLEKNGPVGILFLIFLWLLSLHQGKESDKCLGMYHCRHHAS